MRKFLRNRLSSDGTTRWILSGLYRNPIRFLVALARSAIATMKLTGRVFPLRLRIGPGQKFSIKRGKFARVRLSGNLIISSWGGSSLQSSLEIGNDGRLNVLGDFEIGPNVHMIVGENAELNLGGRQLSSASGITCNSRIMVEKQVSIGSDSIIAWDVFISDSDWHQIAGAQRSSPVNIGDKVWIAHGVSVLKGATIPSGCIVAAKSLVAKRFSTEKALLAGVPARLVRSPVEWAS